MAASSHTPLGLVASTSTSTAASLFAEPNTPHLLKRCFDHIREQLFTAIQNGTCDAKSILGVMGVKRGKSISIALNGVTLQREHVSKKAIALAGKVGLTIPIDRGYLPSSMDSFLMHLVVLREEVATLSRLAKRDGASQLYKTICLEIEETLRSYKEKLLEVKKIFGEKVSPSIEDFYFNQSLNWVYEFYALYGGIYTDNDLSEKMTTPERIKLFMEVGYVDTRNEIFIMGHKRIIKALLKCGVRPDTGYSLHSPSDFSNVLNYHFHDICNDEVYFYSGKINRARANFSLLLTWYLDNHPKMADALIQNSESFLWPNDLKDIVAIIAIYSKDGNREKLFNAQDCSGLTLFQWIEKLLPSGVDMKDLISLFETLGEQCVFENFSTEGSWSALCTLMRNHCEVDLLRHILLDGVAKTSKGLEIFGERYIGYASDDYIDVFLEVAALIKMPVSLAALMQFTNHHVRVIPKALVLGSLFSPATDSCRLAQEGSVIAAIALLLAFDSTFETLGKVSRILQGHHVNALRTINASWTKFGGLIFPGLPEPQAQESSALQPVKAPFQQQVNTLQTLVARSIFKNPTLFDEYKSVIPPGVKGVVESPSVVFGLAFAYLEHVEQQYGQAMLEELVPQKYLPR